MVYTLNENWNGTDTINYQVVDDTGLTSNISTITINVASVNDAPVANSKGAATNGGNAVDITLEGVDVEGDALTYSIVQNPSNGSLSSINSFDIVTYTPNAGWSGSDEFTYKVNDGSLDSNTATVTIEVTNSTTSSYGGEVSLTVNPNSVVEIPFEVTDSGALGPTSSTTDHLRLYIDLKGSTVNTLNDLELILVAPTTEHSSFTSLGKRRILLARGVNTPPGVSDSGHYYLPNPSQEFLNTVFSEEATTHIEDGSNPFIGDYLPNRLGMSLFSMSNHEINGTWYLYIHNHNGGDTIDITKAELQLMYESDTEGQWTYSEKNNFIFSPNDTNDWIVNPNSTFEGSIPISLPAGATIKDIDLELTAYGSTVNTLKDFSVIMMNDNGNQNTVFDGPSTNFSHGLIYKTRFSDDQGHGAIPNKSLIANKLDAYTGFGPMKGSSTNNFRLFFTNNNSGDIVTIDKEKTKIYIEIQ